MRGLKDDHVLALIGVCVDSSVEERRTSPLIVLPFMSNGDLRSYLRDGNNVCSFCNLCYLTIQLAVDYARSIVYCITPSTDMHDSLSL